MSTVPTDTPGLLAIEKRRERLFPGGVGRWSGFLGDYASPTAVRGRGHLIEDQDGRELIDLNNNFTVLVHGHAHPAIVAAGVEALQDGACFGLPNVHELDHAEALVERVPWVEQVRYTNTGTEAVMTAVRVARAHTGREKILIVSPSYHGTADAVLPVTASVRGVPQGVLRDTLLVAPDDVEGLRAMFEQHRDELAAFVLDLMPVAIGARPLSAEFVSTARELSARAGTLMIVDEVISFRLARAGFAHAHYGLEPDLLAIGKVVGGGLPIGAVLGRAQVLAVLDPHDPQAIFHGGTFSGNPLSMRCGLAALELYDDDAIDRLNHLGDRLREALRAAGRPHGWEVGGWGSVLRLMPLPDDSLARRRALWQAAYANGLAMAVSGTLCLSTPMDEAIVDDVARRFARSFEQVAAGEAT